MLESRIINEINGNYLLIMSEEINVSGYELKMFEYNDIKGFLPLSVSRINNTVTYEYRIMQYESFAKKYGSEAISSAGVRNLFSKITSLVHRAAEYLLNADSILLNPEYIYMDGDELLFCYYPSCNQTFHKSLRELMEYILERLDHSGQENIMTAYSLYQKILKNNFTMDGLMEEFFCVPANDMKTQQSMEENMMPAAEEKEQQSNDIFSLEQELEAELINKMPKDKKKKRKWFTLKSRKQEALQTANPTMLLAEAVPYKTTQLLVSKKLENLSGGEDIILSDFPLHIGSSAEDSDFVVNNVTVSRRHAVITMECGGYYIEDMDSTNGTFVNGSRLSPNEPIRIKEGDKIFLANEKYRLN